MIINDFSAVQAQDWPGLNRYRKANKKLGAPLAGKQCVVFMGNSITDIWDQKDPGSFKNNLYVDRGISRVDHAIDTHPLSRRRD